MLAIDIIQRDFRHVSITSTVDEALRWMGKYKLKHLPIIKSKAFLSIISEETLLSVVPASKLGDLKNDGVRVYVSESDHILEVARSEERRVGKECRCRMWGVDCKHTK